MGPRANIKASYSTARGSAAVDRRSSTLSSEQLSLRQTRLLDELERLFFGEGFLHFRREGLPRLHRWLVKGRTRQQRTVRQRSGRVHSRTEDGARPAASARGWVGTDSS